MENTESGKSLFDLSFDDQVKKQLRGAAVWGGITAIVSFAGGCLSLIASFMMRNKMESQFSDIGYNSDARDTMNVTAVAGSVLMFVISLLMFIFLFKFSRKVKSGLDTGDQYVINDGLSGLAAYFRLIGILLIIVIVIMLLAVLAGLGKEGY